MKNVKQHELLASFRDGCLKYDHFDMRRGHDLLRNHPKNLSASSIAFSLSGGQISIFALSDFALL